jgi:hypothetical protein
MAAALAISGGGATGVVASLAVSLRRASPLDRIGVVTSGAATVAASTAGPT